MKALRCLGDVLQRALIGLLRATLQKRQLEPLLCRPQVVPKRSSVHWQLAFGQFYHDLVGLALGVLGDASSGSHQSVLIDLLESTSEDELALFVSTTELCTFGPATGLARVAHCLAAVATSHPALRLTKTVARRLRTASKPCVLAQKSFSIAWLGTYRIG